MAIVASAVVSAVSSLDPTGIASKIIEIARSINGQYEQMKDNKKACKELNHQVNIVSQIVNDLNTHKQADYCKQTLDELHTCLSTCLNLIQSITAKKDTVGKLKSFLSADRNKNLIAALTGQLKDIGDLLNLALTAKSSNNIEDIIALMKQKETEKMPAVKKANQETQKEVQVFVKEVSTINEGNATIEAKAGRDVTTIAGGVKAQGPISIGGGGTPAAEPTPERKEEKPDSTKILSQLKAFFRDEEHEGEKTQHFEAYNATLRPHQAELGYNKKQQKHTLYVNDEPLEPGKAVTAITGMIKALQNSSNDAASSAASSPSSDSATIVNRGNANVRADAGRDVTSIAGGVNSSGAIRIGGGDMHQTYTTAYNNHTQSTSKFNFAGQAVSGNVMQGEKQTQRNGPNS